MLHDASDPGTILEWTARPPKKAELFAIWGGFTLFGAIAGPLVAGDPTADRAGQTVAPIVLGFRMAAMWSAVGLFFVILGVVLTERRVRLGPESVEVDYPLFRRVLPRVCIAGVLMEPGLNRLRKQLRGSIRLVQRGKRHPVLVLYETNFDLKPGELKGKLAQALGAHWPERGTDGNFSAQLAEAERFREGDAYVWRSRPSRVGRGLTLASALVVAVVAALWYTRRERWWEWYVEHVNDVPVSALIALGALVSGALTCLAGEVLLLAIGRTKEIRAAAAGLEEIRSWGRRTFIPADKILGVEPTRRGAYVAIRRGRRVRVIYLAAKPLGTGVGPFTAALESLYGRLIDCPDASECATQSPCPGAERVRS